MRRLDLKDAYLLVPISPGDKKFLRLHYSRQIFQFNSLPLGLYSAPFDLTKLGRPIIEWLSSRGIRIVVYLDDFLILAKSREECADNTKLTISLLQFLGFIINWEKSELAPLRSCRSLGMIIHSNNIT